MASKDHGLTPIELSSFCSEIALMLGAGMPLYAGMEALEKTYEDDAHAALYRGVSETLTQTGSLRDALESAHAFPTYLVEMCGVGERTGHLEDVMRGLSVYYERESRIRQAVRSAVTYPLVLAVMMVLILLVLILKVMPVFRTVLGSMGVTMTETGSVMMSVGTALGWVVLALVLVVVLAALACVLIYVMAWHDGVDPVRIILSGVAINTVLGAYNAFLQMLNSDNLANVLAFMNGSLSGCNWQQIYVITAYSSVGIILGLCCIKSANILQLGDEMATSLGINVSWVRVFLSAVGAFLAASTVAVAGMIGFIGLVVPHIARMMVGSDYKALLPVSTLLGAVLLLAADTLGRTLISGMEIPVGIVMAATGGPFFLYMLRKKGRVSGS
ncbi:iron chelate uptake ABC transporter family permease subunit [uncultured Phascolarctobacterium sp.]|uniref:iron chelate uptake ABC transporter family permease subunit n=1 Tax=uncultured Phascolarctobacterium sp. TaxID=512296 RepID=UPI0025EEC635|nr:iron chelate uptake ABC transporter family permease subunit [uncultured Phascolarctobacterium sp.]